MLLVLIERRGQIVSKDELMARVWPDTFVEESNLSQNIYTLRKVLGQTEDGQDFIKTIPKRGYRFVADVRETRLRSRAPIAAASVRQAQCAAYKQGTHYGAADLRERNRSRKRGKSAAVHCPLRPRRNSQQIAPAEPINPTRPASIVAV